jgi:hypothetical protein
MLLRVGVGRDGGRLGRRRSAATYPRQPLGAALQRPAGSACPLRWRRQGPSLQTDYICTYSNNVPPGQQISYREHRADPESIRFLLFAQSPILSLEEP